MTSATIENPRDEYVESGAADVARRRAGNAEKRARLLHAEQTLRASATFADLRFGAEGSADSPDRQGEFKRLKAAFLSRLLPIQEGLRACDEEDRACARDLMEVRERAKYVQVGIPVTIPDLAADLYEQPNPDIAKLDTERRRLLTDDAQLVRDQVTVNTAITEHETDVERLKVHQRAGVNVAGALKVAFVAVDSARGVHGSNQQKRAAIAARVEAIAADVVSREQKGAAELAARREQAFRLALVDTVSRLQGVKIAMTQLLRHARLSEFDVPAFDSLDLDAVEPYVQEWEQALLDRQLLRRGDVRVR